AGAGMPGFDQARHALGELLLDGLRGGLAVEDLSRHDALLGCGGRGGRAGAGVAGAAPAPWALSVLLQLGVQRLGLGELRGPGAQRLDVGATGEGERDDVGDLGELLRAEAAGGERRGAD